MMLSSKPTNGIGIQQESFLPVMEQAKETSISERKGYGCTVDDPEHMEKAMDDRFAWLQWMLRLTGLMFFDEPNAFWRVLKCARAAVLISISLYQTGFTLKALLNHEKFDIKNARTLVIFSWMLQALLSMGFIIYFQLRCHFSRLRQLIYCRSGCPLTPIVIKRTILLHTALLMFASLEHWWPCISNAKEMFYGTPKLMMLVLVVYFWSTYVWLTALVLFISVVTALNHELTAFNVYKLMKIGEDVEDGDMEKIYQELQECYVHHIELANRIRIVNEMFETFAMLGSNVPTTIFILLHFLLAYQKMNWLSILFIVPDILFSIFELFGLTSAPAKVHATIRDVESIIYKNMRIWTPYNDKVYRIASIFISHANQSNLGITLWGFAVVTKPLILTMISLIVSYLTFVLQVHPEQAAKGNETAMHL